MSDQAVGRATRLDWFANAPCEDVVQAFVEDGSLRDSLCEDIQRAENDWIRIAGQNAADANARAEKAEAEIVALKASLRAAWAEIAAAPDLLAALKHLMRYDFGESEGAKEARAAIAKAEGRA